MLNSDSEVGVLEGGFLEEVRPGGWKKTGAMWQAKGIKRRIFQAEGS